MNDKFAIITTKLIKKNNYNNNNDKHMLDMSKLRKVRKIAHLEFHCKKIK